MAVLLTNKNRIWNLLHYLKNFRHYLKFRNKIILVYSQGRVGSFNTYSTIRKNFPYLKVWHVHYLTEVGLEKIRDWHNFNYHKELKDEILKAIKKAKEVIIVNITREPYSREVSFIFSDYERLIQEKYITNINDTIQWQSYLVNQVDFNNYLDWYDYEFKEITKINIYDYSFDRINKFNVISNGKFNAYIFRLEDYDEVGLKVISSALSVNENKIHLVKTSNEAKTKPYYDAYRNFKKLKFNKSALNYLYESKFFNHFYDNKEKSKLMNKHGI